MECPIAPGSTRVARKPASVNILAKTAQYSIDLQSVFESKKINPIMKKHFDPSFKKKHQEEYDL